jgi:hypothetical protein
MTVRWEEEAVGHQVGAQSESNRVPCSVVGLSFGVLGSARREKGSGTPGNCIVGYNRVPCSVVGLSSGVLGSAWREKGRRVLGRTEL